jgi:hypothetical protein
MVTDNPTVITAIIYDSVLLAVAIT